MKEVDNSTMSRKRYSNLPSDTIQIGFFDKNDNSTKFYTFKSHKKLIEAVMDIEMKIVFVILRVGSEYVFFESDNHHLTPVQRTTFLHFYNNIYVEKLFFRSTEKKKVGFTLKLHNAIITQKDGSYFKCSRKGCPFSMYVTFFEGRLRYSTSVGHHNHAL